MRVIEAYGANRWIKWTEQTQIVEGTHDPVFVRPVVYTEDGARSHWVDLRIGALSYSGAKYSDYAPPNAAAKAAELRAYAERAERSGGTVQFLIHLRNASRQTTLTPAEARQIAQAIDEALQLLTNLPTEKQPTPGGAEHHLRLFERRRAGLTEKQPTPGGAEHGGHGPPSPLQPLADELLFDVSCLELMEELLRDRRQVIFQGPPSPVS